MNALPIVTRELIVQARKPAVHRVRVWVSLAGMLGMTGLFLFVPVADHARGRQLYFLVSGLALVWASVAGVLLTADAINEERARGTLGLLFLTDLNASDILLGKLAANSLNGVMALVSLLPLLAIPMLFGGVSMRWVIAHSVLVVTTLLLSLCVGLYHSARRPDSGTALASALKVMVLITVLPMIFWLGSRGGAPSWLAMLSPLSGYLAVLWPVGGRWLPQHFLTGLACIVGVSAVYFAAAARRLKREGVLDEPVQEAARGAAGVPMAQWFGRGSPPPPGLLETDPIMWLLWRRNRFPRADLTFLRTVLVLGVPMVWAACSGWMWWLPVFLIALALHLALTSHMQSQSSQRIATEQDRTALELLITTPRAATGTLESHHRAFKQLFRTQFWWLAGLYAVLFLGCAKWVAAKDREMLWAPVVPLVILFAGRFAASWVGLSASLRQARYHKALWQTQLCVALPTWGYLVVLLILSPLGLFRTVDWWTAYVGWLIFGALVPFLAGVWHRRQAIQWMNTHGTMLSADNESS